MNFILILLIIVNIMILRSYSTEKLTGDKYDAITKFLATHDDISGQPFFISGQLTDDLDEQTIEKLIELSIENKKDEIRTILKI